MKAVLVIHNLKRESDHALAYAGNLSVKLNVKIMVMYTVPESRSMQASGAVVEDLFTHDGLTAKEHDSGAENIVYLSYLDTLGMSLHEITVKYDIGLIVKGISGTAKEISEEIKPVLNHSCCPLLTVPKDAVFDITNMGYLTDLRYAKKNIASFLDQVSMAMGIKANLFNIVEPGLPHMNDTYANSTFSQSFSNTNLKLVNIKERDVIKTIDVLVHIMQVDFFVLSNRSSQLNAFFDHSDAASKPHTHLPALIFPC